MAQDMVASVTLRLRDQMSAGIDEIKRQFGSVQETLDRLTGVMGDLQKTLDQLKAPTALDDGLAQAATSATATVDAVKAIGTEATISGRKIDAMNVALRDGVNPAGLSAAGVPLGSTPHRHGVVDDEAARPALHASADGAKDWMVDGAMGAIAAVIGLDSVKSLGEYQKKLRQIVITEQLSGPAATAETHRLAALFDTLALRDRQSSSGLADAYYRMITMHIPAAVVRAIMPAIGEMATAHDVTPYSLADAAFAIQDSFKIGPSGVLPALEMLATAAKQAHFSMDNFGDYLKEIGGVAEMMGLTGRHNLDMVAAGLETVVKNSSQPNQADADYRDFLVYLNSPQLQMAGERLGFKKRLEASQYIFSKYHIKPIGLWQLEDKAKSKGQNEVEAILDYLHKVTGSMTDGDRAKYLRTLFGNQQSATTAQSILLHWSDYQAMIKRLDKVTAATGAKDFATALKGANTQVNLFDENMTQMNRGVGRVLKPLLSGVTSVLSYIDRIDNTTVSKKVAAENSPEHQDWEAMHRLHDAVTAQKHATEQNTQALKDGQALASYMASHPRSMNPTPPAGPMLNRP